LYADGRRSKKKKDMNLIVSLVTNIEEYIDIDLSFVHSTT